MWELDSLVFGKGCASWNRSIHPILHLHFTAHTYMLDPLMKQPHMSLQLYKRCARLLYGMKQCRNYIVRSCLSNTMHNTRTPIGHNLIFLEVIMQLILCVTIIIIVWDLFVITISEQNRRIILNLFERYSVYGTVRCIVKADIDTMIDHIANTELL